MTPANEIQVANPGFSEYAFKTSRAIVLVDLGWTAPIDPVDLQERIYAEASEITARMNGHTKTKLDRYLETKLERRPQTDEPESFEEWRARQNALADEWQQTSGAQ